MIGAASIGKKKTYFTKEELMAPFATTNILTQAGLDITTDGLGWTSDPNTFAMMQHGAQSPSAWWTPFAASIVGKGKRTSSTDVMHGLTFSRIGCGGHYFNIIDPGSVSLIKASTRWKLVNGLPTSIIEYDYTRRASGVQFTATAFSQDELIYMPMTLLGTPGMRMAIQVNATGMTGTHYEVLAQPKGDIGVVVITKPTWPFKLVFGCYPTNAWYLAGALDAEPDPFIDVNGSEFPNTAASVTGDKIAAGFTCAFPGYFNHRACYVIGLLPASMTDEQVKDAAVQGLLNWETKYDDAIAYWEDFWASYNARWDNVAPEIRSKGLIGVQQIAASSYKGAVAAGPPNWDGVYLRDICWPLRVLPKVVPEFAKTIGQWFANAAAVNGVNAYDLDGVAYDTWPNVDSGPVYLLGMTALWDATRDTTLFTSLLPQLQSILTYIKANYSETDDHVLVSHPHDFWDDYPTYGGEMDVGLVKYESLIDVLWCAALSRVAPVFDALGDTSNADYCRRVSAELLVSIEAFRDVARLGGGLHYAIKTDDTLYDTVIASPGTMYAAHLLDDVQCREALLHRGSANMLGLRYLPVESVLTFSNYLASNTYVKKDDVWGPNVPLIAGELAKLGNGELLPFIKNSMVFANWPEGMEVDAANPTRLRHHNLAHNFIWSLGELAQLCETLAQINK